MKKAGKRNKDFLVYFSFTTTPKRIGKIEPVIKSMMKQTYEPDKILLNIAKDVEYNIPKFLKKYPKVEINYCEKDYGPITKMLPACLNIQEKNVICIVTDDDIELLPDTVKVYLSFMEKNKDACYTLHGMHSYNLKYENANDCVYVDFPSGYSSFCFYCSRIDKQDFLEYVEKVIVDKNCKMSDDLTIGNYMKKIGVKVIKIYTEIVNIDLLWENGCILEYGRKEDALHLQDDMIKRYEFAQEYLKENKIYYF